MTDPIKRVNYFENEFLHAEDFTDEQAYHQDMRRRHNRLLHTWGIAEGFDFTPPQAGATGVQLSKGVAYDAQGREIVTTDSVSVDLSDHPADRDVFITIAYAEHGTDNKNEAGTAGDTRMAEEPLVDHVLQAPADPGLTLVLGVAKRTNKTVTAVDAGVRRFAGVVGGDLQVHTLRLTDPTVSPDRWPQLRLRPNTAGQVDLTGNLAVSGTLTGTLGPNMVGNAQVADGSLSGAKLSVGSVTGDRLAAGAVDVTKLSVGAVTTDRLAAGAVTADRLADGSITNSKLVNLSVSEPKLANNAISNRTIANLAVDEAKLVDGAVSGAKLKDGVVGRGKLDADTARGLVTAYLVYLGSATPPALLNQFNVDSVSRSGPGSYKVSWSAGASPFGPYVATLFGASGKVTLLGTSARSLTVQIVDDAGRPVDGQVHIICFA